MTIRRRPYRNGHAYFDGDRKIPGVTTIIGAGLPKPALVDWAARTTAEYAGDHWDELTDMTVSERIRTLTGARWETSRAAMGRGTDIHHHAEQLATTGTTGVPEALLGPVTAYANWLRDFDVHTVAAELVVVNRTHGYAGTLDLIADIAGQRWLLDAKTGKGVFPDAALQIAAYRYAEKCLEFNEDGERDMIQVDRTGVIHIGPDTCRLIPVEVGPEQYRMFRYIQQVARWPELSEGLIGEALAPPSGGAHLTVVS